MCSIAAKAWPRDVAEPPCPWDDNHPPERRHPVRDCLLLPETGSHANAVGGKCLCQHERRARGGRYKKLGSRQRRGAVPAWPVGCARPPGRSPGFPSGRRLFRKGVPSAATATILLCRGTSLKVVVSRGFCCRRM
jgi:hypothetical protein